MTEQSVMDVPTWTLGDRLRKAREFAGLEQNELATRIGISRGTVSNYELDHWGVRGPKLIVIREWARTCGVPLDWVIEDAAVSTPGVSSPSNRDCVSSTRPYGFENNGAVDPRRVAQDEAADLLQVA